MPEFAEEDRSHKSPTRKCLVLVEVNHALSSRLCDHSLSDSSGDDDSDGHDPEELDPVSLSFLRFSKFLHRNPVIDFSFCPPFVSCVTSSMLEVLEFEMLEVVDLELLGLLHLEMLGAFGLELLEYLGLGLSGNFGVGMLGVLGVELSVVLGREFPWVRGLGFPTGLPPIVGKGDGCPRDPSLVEVASCR